MQIKLERIGPERKELLYALYQFYEYEFSLYTDTDLEEKGRFAVDLEHFWTDLRWNPYLIRYGDKIAGFLIVLFENYDTDPDPTHVIYDFLILPKYRRKGVGRAAAGQAFEKYRANWKVVQMSANLPALEFWRKTVQAYTAGQYAEVYRQDLDKYVQTFTNRMK